jgi:hypothetical protein
MGYRNMLELDVAKASGDHATVANGGLRLRGLDRRTGDGRHAVVAIRPEDFTVGGGENEIRVRVEVVEYRGRSWPSRRLRRRATAVSPHRRASPPATRSRSASRLIRQ